MNNIVVVEIEKTARLTLIATPYITPVWKYDLWISAYIKNLPFMADSDPSYSTEAYQFSNLLVDYAPYYLATTLEECIDTSLSYYIDGPTLYVHYSYNHPPFVFASIMYGRLFGFTNRGVKRYNRVTYLSNISSIPRFSEIIDPVAYSKMSDNSGTVVLSNSDGAFDEMASVFGNDVNIKFGTNDGEYSSLKNIVKYYVNNYAVSLKEASFSLKDKRSLLSTKYPNEFFEQTTYPYLENDHIDKLIPDAFGTCFGVPGICINGDEGNVDKIFKFAGVITTLTAVYVYRDEQWNDITGDVISIDNSNGTVTLPVSDAHDNGDYTNGILDVKMDGVFRPETNPGDVIAKLNYLSEGIEFLANNYNLMEWESELRPLKDIGIYMAEQKETSEWIELIQNGSVVGFEYMYDYDKITARLDNPNRTPVMSIDNIQVVNMEDVEIDYNAGLYASIAKINYKHDENEDTYLSYINDTFRPDVLEIHRKDYQYETNSLLPTEESAITKSNVIMDDQKQIRPIYRNIKLWGYDFFDLRLYDIVNVDLSIFGIIARIPYIMDEYVIFMDQADEDEVIFSSETTSDVDIVFTGVRGKKIVPNTNRTFAGIIRAQIIERELDPENGCVTITIRQRDESIVVASALEE
jgi:hypothetical protein